MGAEGMERVAACVSTNATATPSIPHALPEPSFPPQEGEPIPKPLNLGAPVTSLINGEQRLWCCGVGESRL